MSGVLRLHRSIIMDPFRELKWQHLIQSVGNYRKSMFYGLRLSILVMFALLMMTLIWV